MTNYQKRLVEELRKTGYSYYEISKEVGVTQDAIRNYFYRKRIKNKEPDTPEITAIKALQQRINKLTKERNAMQSLSIIDAGLAELINVPTYKIKPFPLKDPSNKEAILKLSDIHYGLLHKGISNVYTPEIAEDRLIKVIQKVNSYLKKYYPDINKLHIFMEGDFIDGYGIFKGQEYSVIPLTEQISVFPSVLSSALAMLEVPFDVYAVPGNHGRLTSGVPQHNWDRVIFHLVKKSLPDVKFTIADDMYLPVEVGGVKFILLHGDGITRSKKPSSFIERSVGEFTIMFKNMGISFDYLSLGHFHTPYSLPNALVNGSLCGDTHITTHYIKTSQKPSQSLYIIEDGKITTWRKLYAQD